MILNNSYSHCLYLAYYSPSYIHNGDGLAARINASAPRLLLRNVHGVRSIFLLRMLTAKRNIYSGHADHAKGHILTLIASLLQRGPGSSTLHTTR